MATMYVPVGVESDLGRRLHDWARATHGWTDFGFCPTFDQNKFAFKVGPHTGYGDTPDEAVNYCADGLVEDGWPGDRPDVDT